MNKTNYEIEKDYIEQFLVDIQPLQDDPKLSMMARAYILDQRRIVLQRLYVLDILIENTNE